MEIRQQLGSPDRVLVEGGDGLIAMADVVFLCFLCGFPLFLSCDLGSYVKEK